MKRRCHHRKIDRDLEQLNQNLNTIIQNQNELYSAHSVYLFPSPLYNDLIAAASPRQKGRLQAKTMGEQHESI